MTGSDKPAVLLTKPVQTETIRLLEDRFELHRLDLAEDRDELLAAIGSRIRAVVIGREAVAGSELFDQLPRLEIVANFGVGYDTVDTTEAARRGLMVTNTPDVLTDEVADLTVGLLLATVRRIPQADRYLRQGGWRQRTFPLTTSLRGRHVGIVGLGRIGEAVAKRLEGFGVSIAYHTRRRRPDIAYPYHETLLGLAQACDVLIILAPGNAQTHHLIDTEILSALGRDGILVNVARGSLVDEAALVDALRTGAIHAAGLDVFESEPHVSAELTALDNTVLLPHVGSASHHTRRVMGDLVIENLASWFAGKGPVTPVPETPWSGIQPSRSS